MNVFGLLKYSWLPIGPVPRKNFKIIPGSFNKILNYTSSFKKTNVYSNNTCHSSCIRRVCIDCYKKVNIRDEIYNINIEGVIFIRNPKYIFEHNNTLSFFNNRMSDYSNFSFSGYNFSVQDINYESFTKKNIDFFTEGLSIRLIGEEDEKNLTFKITNPLSESLFEFTTNSIHLFDVIFPNYFQIKSDHYIISVSYYPVSVTKTGVFVYLFSNKKSQTLNNYILKEYTSIIHN